MLRCQFEVFPRQQRPDDPAGRDLARRRRIRRTGGLVEGEEVLTNLHYDEISGERSSADAARWRLNSTRRLIAVDLPQLVSLSEL